MAGLPQNASPYYRKHGPLKLLWDSQQIDQRVKALTRAGRSGMTPPVPQADKLIPFSIKQYFEAQLTKNWQQVRLEGFTTNEMIAAGAYAGAVKDEDLRDFGGQLDNEIHPLYA
jgi:hypothetical protein